MANTLDVEKNVLVYDNDNKFMAVIQLSRIKAQWLEIAELYRNDEAPAIGLCNVLRFRLDDCEITWIEYKYMKHQLKKWMRKKGYADREGAFIGFSFYYENPNEPIGCNFCSKLYRALVAEELAAQL